MPQVSIVIVCMNNLGNLYPCLDSIKKYTTVSYETFVVAYLFTDENKAKLRADYPWVTVIESDEIRGFSENNNLALRQAKGEYCFVVNDDTLMHEPVIDRLVDSFNHVPVETAIVSPRLVRIDGKTQFLGCGRPKMDWKRWVLHLLKLWSQERPNEYINQDDVFQTYNIVGASFLIKTNIFKDMGWFDEYYFFCPEDIALSTKLNKEGYKCYVNADVNITHLEGMSGKSLSMIKTATEPAGIKGRLHFYSRGNLVLRIILSIIISAIFSVKFIINYTRGLFLPKPNKYLVLAVGQWHTILNIYNKLTPKEIFTKYYNKL